MLAHPAWSSWCKLVEVYSVAAQHELEVTDIELLDDLVLDHSNLFDQVPEYVGYKRPKHHFLSHLAVDAWRYGPPRGYWCFGFESFNKVVKAGCNHSWKGETAACMRYWSMCSARAYVQRNRTYFAKK